MGPRTKLLTEDFFVPGESGALLTGGMLRIPGSAPRAAYVGPYAHGGGVEGELHP